MGDGEYRILSPFREVPVSSLACEDNGALLRIWREKAGDRFAPPWTEFDLLDLPASYIPRIMVVDVIPGQDDFRYRFFGTWQTDCHKVDMSGKRISDYPHTEFRDEILRGYLEVVKRKVPLLFHYHMTLENVAYQGELLRLPLSDDGEAVTAVIMGETLFDETS